MNLALVEDKLIPEEGVQGIPSALAISSLEEISDDFIVSHKSDGSPASHFSDDSWDFTAYTTASSALSMCVGWSKLKPFPDILRQVKKIVIAHKYFSSNLISAGEIVRIAIYFRLVGRMLGEKGLDFSNRSDSDYLNILAEWREVTPSSVLMMIVRERGIKELENKLSNIEFSFLSNNSYGAFVDVSSEWVKEYKQNKTQQTTVIPSRIYSEVILQNELFADDFDLIKENFYKIVKSYYTIEDYGLKEKTQRCNLIKKHKKGLLKLPVDKRRLSGNDNYDWRQLTLLPSLEEEVEKYNLGWFFDKWGYKKNHISSINKILTDVQFNVYLYLLIFTGARQGEIKYLSYNCIEEFNFDGDFTYVINGVTSKLVGEITNASWIVGDNAKKFIGSAQEISDIVISCRGDLKINYDRYPLFPALSQFSKRRKSKIHPLLDYPHQNNMLDFSNCGLKFIKGLLITTEDIFEVMEIDPSYGYLEDSKFNVSAPWPFANHQFRRSLVVYAFKHGIAHTDIKWQLKHILLKMTLWYGKNGAFAKAIISTDDHVLHDFNLAIEEYKSTEYLRNVLSDNSIKAAPHGRHINRIIASDGLESTIKMVKRGEVQYTETPLGGCVASECSMSSYIVLTDCIDCKSFVVSNRDLKKINRAEQHLLKVQALHEEESYFYRSLQKQLDDLDRLKRELIDEEL